MSADAPKRVIDLAELPAAPEVIDLSDVREPSLRDVARSAVVRRASARALRDLEAHHGHAPWLVVCEGAPDPIAASPSFTPVEQEAGKEDAQPARARWSADDGPLSLVSLDWPGDVDDDDPAVAAAQLVTRALNEIVAAERRAALANLRAGRAEALAATDALTGTSNQRAWWDRITEEEARRARTRHRPVIAVIDLDDLKVVNDTRGHLHGDLLLRLAAQTLRRAVRPFDLVARVGGDEFAVLAVDYDGDPAGFRERIIEALEEADIPASVGIAVPEEGQSLTETFAAADQAMYVHKRARHAHAGGR